MFQAFKDEAKRFKDRVKEFLFHNEKVAAGLLAIPVLLSAVWAYTEGQSVLKMMEAKRTQQVQVEAQKTQKTEMLKFEEIQQKRKELVREALGKEVTTGVHVMTLTDFLNFVNRNQHPSKMIHLSKDVPDVICFKDTVMNNATGVGAEGYFIIINDHGQIPKDLDPKFRPIVDVEVNKDYLLEQIKQSESKNMQTALGPYMIQSVDMRSILKTQDITKEVNNTILKRR